MELKDTIEMMTSADYQERFRAEFEQTSIRYEKLQAMIAKYKAGTLDFVPKCSVELLERQAEYMHNYLAVLEERAEIEGVELTPTAHKVMEDADKPGYITAYVPRKTK